MIDCGPVEFPSGGRGPGGRGTIFLKDVPAHYLVLPNSTYLIESKTTADQQRELCSWFSRHHRENPILGIRDTVDGTLRTVSCCNPHDPSGPEPIVIMLWILAVILAVALAYLLHAQHGEKTDQLNENQADAVSKGEKTCSNDNQHVVISMPPVYGDTTARGACNCAFSRFHRPQRWSLPLTSPKYAGSPNGRFIFVVGEQTPKPYLGDDRATKELATSFQLDVIDLFVAKRTRLSVGDFFNFGHLTGFYALDDRRVVLMDYDRVTGTLRQRLIDIDLKKGTASCFVYRGYHAPGLAYFLVRDFFIYPQTSAGERYCVTTSTSMEQEDMCLTIRNVAAPSGLVCPLNPLSRERSDNINDIIDVANAHIANCYAPGDQGAARVSTLRPPFFIAPTVLGFFIDPLLGDDVVDPINVCECDLFTGRVQIRETTAPLSISFSDERFRPFVASWATASHSEVALAYKYRRTPWCWQAAVEKVLLCLIWPFVKINSFLQARGYTLLRIPFLVPIIIKFVIYWRIQRTYPTSLALLNTKTLEWSAIKTNVQAWETIIPLRNGHFVLASKVYTVGGSRMIGQRTSLWQKERFRLIRNPHRLSTLSHLSSIATQKSGRVPRELLEQIAARMLS